MVINYISANVFPVQPERAYMPPLGLFEKTIIEYRIFFKKKKTIENEIWQKKIGGKRNLTGYNN